MTPTRLVAILRQIYLIVSALVGFASSRQRLREQQAEKLKKIATQSYAAVASIYPILQEALHKFDEVDRVTVFRSHNGTGIPQVGQLSYTSCIQEVHTGRTTSIIERWQKIPSDRLMVEAIAGMHSIGSATLPVTDEDCPGGILTDFCRGNNIKTVLAVPIDYQPDGFLFLNFCSASCPDLRQVDGVLFEAASCAARVAKAINAG